MQWRELPWKRIALFVVLVALLITSLWFIFRRTRTTLPVTPPTPVQQPITGLPTAQSGAGSTVGGNTQTGNDQSGSKNTGKTIILSDYLLYAPAAQGSNLIAFDQRQGAFVKIDSNGNVNPFDAFRMTNVQGVTWSSDRTSAIVRQSDGTQTAYNFQTKQRLTLPSTWTEVKFAANNRMVIFKNASSVGDARWLAAGNITNGGITLLRPLGDNASSVTVAPSPDGSVAALATIPVDGNSQNLYFIDSKGGVTEPVQIQGGFIQAQWSPSGQWFLFSTADTTNQFKPQLWLGAGEGPNRGNHVLLPLPTTAQQCAFAKDSTLLVCAVPSGPPQSGYGVSEGSIPGIPHTVMAIDLITGTTRTLFAPPTPSTLTTPVVTADGKTLYVTNRTTGLLESIAIP
ncbi:hypothetical protein HZA86_03250 [Candidatus Uhrbacteria bacterium]|nr:hypothetical protein [Candidatus Uhrbacteria bacterium]